MEGSRRGVLAHVARSPVDLLGAGGYYAVSQKRYELLIEETQMDYDIYRALEQNEKVEKEKKRKRAAAHFWEAHELARHNGLVLKRHTDVHYSLTTLSRSFLINLYPENGRIYQDKSIGNFPFIPVSENWTLVEVVQKVIDIMKEQRNENEI